MTYDWMQDLELCAIQSRVRPLNELRASIEQPVRLCDVCFRIRTCNLSRMEISV